VDESLDIWTGPTASYSEAMRQHVQRRLRGHVQRLKAQISE
jgi:hypothetical protein